MARAFKKEVKTIYSRTMICKKIVLEFSHVGGNIKETLEECISSTFEGKCITEGYIKPRSSKILTYSSPIVQGNNVVFDVEFECQVFYPVEGQLIQCICKNITKVGIK